MEQRHSRDAEFLDVIGTKSLKSFSPCYSQSLLLTVFYSPSPSPLSKSSLKLAYDVNNVYGTETSSLRSRYHDYAQKPQRNCTFMNSASVCVSQRWAVHKEVQQIANPQFCGRKHCVRFADLSQMEKFSNMRFANSTFL
jgi:hypothetical protein